VITGGSSGIGALLANTLALRHCTVAVLDTHPIETENRTAFHIVTVLRLTLLHR
jgi:NAD(P)-dependent dehydrogenase (short-subunit alcohol dehydrogenase family)